MPALTLTNPIAFTLRDHFTRQDETLLAALRNEVTHITDPHTYKQAYCDFNPVKNTCPSSLTSIPYGKPSIEIEIRLVYKMYHMRRFTTYIACAGCCLWALSTMPFRELKSQG
jgi:hypothetical protein